MPVKERFDVVFVEEGLPLVLLQVVAIVDVVERVVIICAALSLTKPAATFTPCIVLPYLDLLVDLVLVQIEVHVMHVFSVTWIGYGLFEVRH